MTKIPNFDLIKLIGKGAYGEVWLARDVNHLHTDRYRAIKIVQRGAGEHERPYQREYEGVLRYEPVSREHAGLTDILQVGLLEDQECFFYVMELADDCSTGPKIIPDSYTPRTLQHELDARGRLSLHECARITSALADGLAFLHGNNLVHRDIKPSNIISVNGKWKYADTGLVAGADEEKTFVGTLGYLPPEGSGKPAADIFSLGKVLYQICTGMDCHEFPGLPRDLEEMRDPLFKKLNGIYIKACEYNPEARSQDAAEILGELEDSTVFVESTVNPSQSAGDMVHINILDEEGVVVGSFSLKEGEHIIGRKGYGNIVSIDDKSVSRKHAKLIVSDGQLEVEDLKSTYGTHKAGTKILGRTLLHSGERIRIGQHYVQLDSDDGTIVPISESSETLGEGRYKKLAKLGRGAFGEVWRVFDSKLGVDLAVKLLPEDMLNEDSESYFEREVHKTRELSHENIVRIYDLHLFPGEPPFLTMELIDGHNLETERLRRAGDIFPWEELQPLVGQLCNAVGYIHEKGIVHRDIKPANIVLTREGQVKLGDFGCARSMIISIITLKQLAKNPNLPLMGTMAYMSKQTLEGEKPDAADDIYSIGAMLYEMLTGETPFSWDQSQEQLMQEIIDTDPLPPGAVFVQRDKTNPIPDHVSGMIMKCLSKDPAQRPASASMIAKVFC